MCVGEFEIVGLEIIKHPKDRRYIWKCEGSRWSWPWKLSPKFNCMHC